MKNDELSAHFRALFNQSPDGITSAPGRVNLIGEFTDYNDGYVLPCALKFYTQVAYKKRSDNQVVVYSLQYAGQHDKFASDQPIEQGESHWGNYVRAVVFAMQARGAQLGGMDLLIESNVPQGAGLSSSAALEVSVAGAFNVAFELGYSNKLLALIGQQAENDFMNCQCGIMDQLISAEGMADHALLIDCQSLDTQPVPMPDNLQLLIINSNYPRKLVDSEYNQRRLDCQAAADTMGKPSLREADLALLNEVKPQLSENQYKRAHHVITENQRVLASLEAMKSGDVKSLSELMTASHQSLKQDFEVTVPATDWLVQACHRVLGESGGVRMTGGGFGGAIVCLSPADKVEQIKQTISDGYTDSIGLKADIYECRSGDGLVSDIL